MKRPLKIRIATALALQQQARSTEQQQATAIEEDLQTLNARLQHAALMVGIASNILLDNLSTLSDFQVIWAKELKQYGNLFMRQLEKTEQRIWNHVGEHNHSFFQLASILEQTFNTILKMDYDKLMQLIAAVEQIDKQEVVQVESQEQLHQLLNTKQLIKKIIEYVQSKPRISQLEVLQYLRTIEKCTAADPNQ